MKKMSYVPALSRLTILAIAFAAILLSACSKNDNDDFESPPSAGLMLFNLSPDKPSIGFTISGRQLGNSALGYTNYSGIYLPIFAASRELRSFDVNNGASIVASIHTFADSSYYSAFLVGSSGNYRNVVVKDDYTTVVPVAGKSWVRYINAVTDTVNTANVTVAGTTEAAAFATVSDFKQVNAGEVSVGITAETFNANRTFTFAENKIYTILLVGQPGSTDPLLAPQIKFIENGTATNN